MIKRTICVMMICLLLTLWTAGSLIPGMAKDEKLLLTCFDRYAETGIFDVQKTDYPLFAAQLSAFFRHETDDPNTQRHPFHDYEVVHLQDVRNLMDGMDAFAQSCLAAATGMLLLTIMLYHRQRFSLLPGFVVYLLLVAAVVLYAVLDFNQVFVFLHELLFTNELWLLNPSTDLLIALMPESMFMYLAQRILLGMLPLLAAMLLVSLISRKFIQPRH